MRNLSPRITVASAVVVSLVVGLSGQAPATSKDDSRNPFAGNPEAIRQGAVLFRQECVYCHGVRARGGVRGPDLTTGSWNHGGSDAELSRTISNGVPGTAMPANHLTDDEIWRIVSYLRTEQQPPASSTGDARRGEALFFEGGRCSRCHIVGGRGGRLGPELSHIGSARPRAYLIESIREPDRQLADNRSFGGGSTLKYDTITAVTRDGKTVVGVPINQKTFNVPIQESHENVPRFAEKKI